MRYSQYFIPTVKETPADAEVISHQLMLRAGMIRKVAAGIYNYLPLGLRSLRKVENIIREEMNRAGAIEILMPSVQPAELWQESGRWEKYGKELLRFRDRKDTEFCLGPTHEEVVTDIVRREIKSYRQMPLNLYQVQGKFRDEIRPRFGLMRGREFVMKDAYSFDVDEKAADLSYDKMYQAYRRIFQRCGLKFRAVEADTGSIGGSYSHEFMVLAESGEDAIVSCNSCEYAANVEKAETRPVEAVTADALPLEKVSTPGKKTIYDVAGFLCVKPENLLKTLVFTTEDGTPVVAVLRGDHELNEIKLKNAVGCAEIVLAGEDVTEKVTGAPVGFAGPVGLKGVKIVADVAVRGMVNFFTGGNEKDLHLKNVNVDRDFSVSAFADIRNVTAGDRCPRCETGAMEEWRGIEVGHVFKLGTKYSEALRATYLDADGKEQTIFMGCYGIGVGRSVAACIEQNHDKDGIVFPLPIAPFHCIISVLNPKDEPVAQAAEEVYQELQTAGVEVLLDDRDERPGSKFKDADLIGIPIRIVVGAKSLAEGNVELKVRKSGEVQLLPKGDVASIVRQMVTEALAGGAQ